MRTPLRCLVGLHHWHDDQDAEDGTDVIVCSRCHRTETKPHAVMLRIGWIGHQNS